MSSLGAEEACRLRGITEELHSGGFFPLPASHPRIPLWLGAAPSARPSNVTSRSFSYARSAKVS